MEDLPEGVDAVQYNHHAGVKARGRVPEECAGHATPADACGLCDLVDWRGALAAFLLRPNAATQAHVDALKRKVTPREPGRMQSPPVNPGKWRRRAGRAGRGGATTAAPRRASRLDAWRAARRPQVGWRDGAPTLVVHVSEDVTGQHT